MTDYGVMIEQSSFLVLLRGSVKPDIPKGNRRMGGVQRQGSRCSYFSEAPLQEVEWIKALCQRLQKKVGFKRRGLMEVRTEEFWEAAPFHLLIVVLLEISSAALNIYTARKAVYQAYFFKG